MADTLPLELGSTDFTGVQEEVFSTSAQTAGLPDIHDANRKKIAILIRPRCKEYVLKQRSIRTLSCFTPASKGGDTTIPDAKTQSTDASPSTVAKPLPSTATKTAQAPSRKPRAPPTKPRAMLASGRIEKSRSPPRKVAPDLPKDALSVVELYTNLNYELYTCGCATPSECRQCTLRRLADKFCAIVTARKEKIRASTMYS
ncbi:hypothetical protein B0H17DRAFT_1199943 [Mycena rosella]|uniref:Uncharacterized protein n=1 Tax=Mycena rosella TaxID=1033263 RepID=A0AAD7DKE7_MYCRO|nr:hypothetical protein B0H17DRAFT_1199943 [Mycena rosella]